MTAIQRPLAKKNDFKHRDSAGQLGKYFCRVPFNEFHIYRGGFVSNCCFNWLPTEVGNIHKQSLLEMSDSFISKQIKDSVKDGSFKFCSSSYCPALNSILGGGEKLWPLEASEDFDAIFSADLQKRVKIYLSFDYSCNLSCASCRNEKIFFDRKTAPQSLLREYELVSEQIVELLDHGYRVDVNITGSGDAFASPLYYELMCNLPATERLRLHISTNGTMMTEKKLNMPSKNQIQTIFVSVDSCHPENYAKIRRGGVLKHVETNLAHLDRMVLGGQLPGLESWQLNVIVQKDNFRELGDFVDWAKKFQSLKAIFMTKILDWNHLPKDAFKEMAVWEMDHPDHKEFCRTLNDPRLRDPRVILGNLTEYLDNSSANSLSPSLPQEGTALLQSSSTSPE